jgi:hypothetical protein
MDFFKAIPKTLYTFDFKNQSPKVITNIFSRFRIRSQVLNNAYAFYKYQLEDGDTPEIVAYKQYGDPKLHWIICLTNELIDPQFDFPLPYPAFEEYVIKKYNYNTIDDSYSDVHHFELEVERTVSEVDGPTTVTVDKSIVTLQQYDYKLGTLVLQVPNSPTISSVQIKANSADPNSAVTSVVSIKSTYKPIYVFDYENSINESKRQIKILKSQYVQAINFELETVLNG